jgi:hypothetical protein
MQVLRVDSFIFRMYKRDHPPPHVHVWRSGAKCVVRLGTADSPATLLRQGKMRSIDARRAVWIATGSWELLQMRWRMLHAKPHA